MADFAGAKRAIKDRLRAAWTTTPILFENEEAPGIGDDAGELRSWVECRIVSDEADIHSFGSPGSNVHIDRGAVEITVFVPAGTGDDDATAHATAIGEIYRDAEFYKDGLGACVRTLVPQVGGGGRATSENPAGVWFAVPVTVPFQFYYLA